MEVEACSHEVLNYHHELVCYAGNWVAEMLLDKKH
jgi:hypothetical protein